MAIMAESVATGLTLVQYPRVHILSHNYESNGANLLKTQSLPPVIHLLNKATHLNPSPKVPPTRDQVFQYVSLRERLSLKTLQDHMQSLSSSEVCCLYFLPPGLE